MQNNISTDISTNGRREAGRYGASESDWQHFAHRLGLLSDVLPVVSNPAAIISPTSNLSELGKVPSLYRADGLAVGIAAWTGRHTTPGEVVQWAARSDYGLCVQTRQLRAIDVDVTDPALAEEVRVEIEAALMLGLPTRYRANSSKFLQVFRLPGEFAKRKIQTAAGIIEFLANGQQFVAVGRHPSGARYEWATDGVPGLPEPVEIGADEFEYLWAHLTARFAVEPPAPARVVNGPSGAAGRDPATDEVGQFLDANDWTIEAGRDGVRYVRCPWEDQHTTDTGPSSSAWFPAGSGGYAQGHYRCLHAHCEHRGDQEFLGAVGYLADGFEDLTATAAEVGEILDAPLPAFDRKKDGHIKAGITNVAAGLRRADFCGHRFGFDTFRDELCIGEHGATTWRPLTDEDITAMRENFSRQGFEDVRKDLMRDLIFRVAGEQHFDSAKDWLAGLEWDGVPRVERFMAEYFGADDTPYARAISLYLWTALSGRVVEPGCKADIVPIFEGAQGIGKSTGVAALSPSPEYFAEISFADKEEDLARRMRGTLVGEVAELDGLRRREGEFIKKFITRQHEKWVPKYKEFATTFARRLVFIGTTNRTDLLADETGNRRWAPIRVRSINLQAINRDRDQLWAEGAELFNLIGVAYQGLEDLAAPAHEAYAVHDEWEDVVGAWLREPDPMGDTGDDPRGDHPFQTLDVLGGALGFATKDVRRPEQTRVSAILRRLGYMQKKTRLARGNVQAWHREK